MSEKQKTPDNATILIRLNGDLTTAVYLPDYDSDDGIQFGRGSTARRNPADKYDAYVGARLALDRLFGKEEAEEEHKPRWKVGDRVIAAGLPINPDFYGHEGTVVEAREQNGGFFQYTAEFGELKARQHWSDIFADAVRPAAEKPKEPKEPENPLFRNGDIVRVVHPICTLNMYQKGDTLRVIYAKQNGCEIEVLSKPNRGNKAYVCNHEIELVHRPGKEGAKK